MRSVSGPLCLAVISVSPSAFAQAGSAPTAVELYYGPVVAPSRMVGMGAAYTSIGEGAGAQFFNPAAVANRFVYTSHEFFDWDWDLDWLVVQPTRTGVDFEDSGSARLNQSVTILNGALEMMLGRFGIGLSFVTESIGASNATWSNTQGTLSFGYNFLDGELVTGIQLIAANDQAVPLGQSQANVQLRGGGVGAGVLWRPRGSPLRAGLTLRSPIHLSPSASLAQSTLPLPERGTVPWQIGLGLSYTIGQVLNPPVTFQDSGESGQAVGPTDVDKRPYVTVAVDSILIGRSQDAVSFETWIDGTNRPVGRELSVSVRAGIDSEFWADQMSGRVGFYWEPSRFEDTHGRTHVTAGIDVRLFELIWVWRAGLAVDLAERYNNTMLSLGFWH
jgi:hypothetical protein